MTAVVTVLTAAVLIAWLALRVRRHLVAIDAITHRRDDDRFARAHPATRTGDR